jgi:poly-gamma-glutamate capsule biosynthesis protein CapA/YwtB (metallophosphatase superfamily)
MKLRCLLMLAQLSLLPAQEAPQAPAQEPAKTLTIAAVGDTMVGSVYPTRAAMPPESGRRAFERVKALWSGADIVFGNFEGTVCSDPSAVRALGANSYRFLEPAENLAIYKEAGFTVLNVAHNHAMDAGLAARAATLDAMDQAGLAHAGSLERPTAILEVKGLKVGFLGAAPHMDCFPLDAVAAADAIRALKETDGCALVVVSMHAGAEGDKALHVPKAHELFLGADRGDVYAFARAAVDAGADLVLGHGPHVPRGMEVYKGRLIAYSLGNFATHGAFNLKGVNGLGLVLEAVLGADGTLKGLRIHSTRQEKGSEAWNLGIPVEPDPDEGARKLIERLSREDLATDLAAWYLPTP